MMSPDIWPYGVQPQRNEPVSFRWINKIQSCIIELALVAEGMLCTKSVSTALAAFGQSGDLLACCGLMKLLDAGRVAEGEGESCPDKTS